MIFCADDYGLSDDINRAILELCGLGRLSAVSCMTALESCGTKEMEQLLAHQAGMDIGLHLCFADETLPSLTCAADGRAMPPLPAFGAYLRRTLCGRVPSPQVCRQVSAQYELFLKKCGRPPDFIDGHLHAHQLPGVRKGLIKFVSSLPAGSRPWIRNTRASVGNLRRHRLPWVKAAFIGAFGSKMFAALKAAGMPTNEGFAGIYDFRNWRKYPDYFPGFTACLQQPNGILVLHPGTNENWRRQEFATLRQTALGPGSLNRFQRGTHKSH